MSGERWEVVVVGAGPAGSATAAHLARAGRAVLLLDRAEFPRPKPCAEYASPETEQVLRRLGAWPRLEAAGLRRLSGMTIISPSGRRFESYYLQAGEPRYSLAIPRLRLDQELLRHAAEAGAEVRCGQTVEAPLWESGRVVGVRMRDREGATREPRADLVVGAGGLGSGLARSLGGARPARWPRRFGLATHLRRFDAPTDRGEMYIGRGGYLGLAPLADGLTTVAAALPLRPATRPERGPLGHLVASLGAHPGLLARIAGAERAGPFRGVGQFAWEVPRCAGPGFLLVGDAAGFFDPLTGEGIFRALRGAELAGAVALGALADGDWARAAGRYRRLRREAFGAKERLARLIQLFVNCPPLLDYTFDRLERRPELAEPLGAALGDFAPASIPLHPLYLARLLRP